MVKKKRKNLNVARFARIVEPVEPGSVQDFPNSVEL